MPTVQVTLPSARYRRENKIEMWKQLLEEEEQITADQEGTILEVMLQSGMKNDTVRGTVGGNPSITVKTETKNGNIKVEQSGTDEKTANQLLEMIFGNEKYQEETM